MMVSIICISAGIPARDWQYCDSNLIQILLTTFTQSEHIKPLSSLARAGLAPVYHLVGGGQTGSQPSPGARGLYWAEIREKDDNLL